MITRSSQKGAMIGDGPPGPGMLQFMKELRSHSPGAIQPLEQTVILE